MPICIDVNLYGDHNMSDDQLDLFIAPSAGKKTKESKLNSFAEQASRTIDPYEPTPDLIALIEERTGCDVQWRDNLQTLRRWLRDYGEERIRNSVPGCRYFYNGDRHRDGTEGANRRYLSSWEWQSFAPSEERYAFAL
jgi:hypothetical protein